MTTNTTAPKVSYELVVTRIAGTDSPMPVYEAFVYRTVLAGVCGPFSEFVELEGMGTVIEWVTAQGYTVDGFPEIDSRGVATYALVR